MPLSLATRYYDDFPTSQSGLLTSERSALEEITSFPNFTRHHGPRSRMTWEDHVDHCFNELLRLKLNWDGYGASPPNQTAVSFAKWVLKAFMRANTPFPQIVPDPSGAVQLEWHEKGVDLEILVMDAMQTEVWFVDHKAGTRLSCDLTNDFSDLTGPFKTLADR